jgi:hypothetical protein
LVFAELCAYGVGFSCKKVEHPADICPTTISRRHLENIPGAGAGTVISRDRGAGLGNTATGGFTAQPNNDRVGKAISA